MFSHGGDGGGGGGSALSGRGGGLGGRGGSGGSGGGRGVKRLPEVNLAALEPSRSVLTTSVVPVMANTPKATAHEAISRLRINGRPPSPPSPCLVESVVPFGSERSAPVGATL